ncbi:MAG: hypothetical protein U0894_07720 [Pirellulales bacterium]
MKSLCLSLLLTGSILISQVAAQQEATQPSANEKQKAPNALELAKEKVTKHPEDAEAQYRLAIAYRRELKTQEAVPHISEAIKQIQTLANTMRSEAYFYSLPRAIFLQAIPWLP